MDVHRSIIFTLRKLYDVLAQLNGEQYSKALEILDGSSVGQHTRHILEFFLELKTGYASGEVNYEKRKRDQHLAGNLFVALDTIMLVEQTLYRDNKEIMLTTNEHVEDGQLICVPTNYHRELIYNLEHTVHHMALIRIGLKSFEDVIVPKEFGVASSTIKFQEQSQP